MRTAVAPNMAESDNYCSFAHSRHFISRWKIGLIDRGQIHSEDTDHAFYNAFRMLTMIEGNDAIGKGCSAGHGKPLLVQPYMFDSARASTSFKCLKHSNNET